MKRRLTTPAIALALFCVAWPCAAFDEATWVEIDNTIYGAKPDKLGSIGGGNGYANIITKGDYTVRDVDALLEALSKAKAGQVVFIPGETEIDLTARIYIEQVVLEVPEGVTLAGDRGHNGSKGALLSSDALKTPVLIRAAGPNVRITGLHIRGLIPNGILAITAGHSAKAAGEASITISFPLRQALRPNMPDSKWIIARYRPSRIPAFT